MVDRGFCDRYHPVDKENALQYAISGPGNTHIIARKQTPFYVNVVLLTGV